MLKTLKLLFPALFPSWNFFDTIAPSPRIEYAVFSSDNIDSNDKSFMHWHAFRPHPKHVPFPTMLKRMLWNPRWNETLFMTSCSERILANPDNTQHSEDAILKTIINDLQQEPSFSNTSSTLCIQFRLLTLQRKNTEIIQEHVFQSRRQQITHNDMEDS